MPDPDPNRPRRKLIEVDLPLGAISEVSIGEATGARGHPFTIHKYWARRTLASCRAVLFASLVDDPGDCDGERERLHELIERLASWRSGGDDATLDEARIEIARSIARSRGEEFTGGGADALQYLADHAPALHDPFSGGGIIPLEAHRLGLPVIATDLNPISVMINKALIELPGLFAGRPPVNPDSPRQGSRQQMATCAANGGLADDVRYYGAWVRQQVHERIKHLYPPVRTLDGREITPSAWLWVRAVPCPNPACGMPMPLLRSFQIYARNHGQRWVMPVVDLKERSLSFTVQETSRGVPDVRGIDARNERAYCITCQAAVSLDYVREQGRSGRMRSIMLAVVANGGSGRVFLSPDEEQVRAATCDVPSGSPTGELPGQALGFRVQAYGFRRWSQLFTNRQLVALTTLSEVLSNLPERVAQDGGDPDYARAILVYLACAFGKTVDNSSSFCRWRTGDGTVAGTLTRPVLPMLWDFAEVNPFGNRMQNWMAQVESVARVIEGLPHPNNGGVAYQKDAAAEVEYSQELIVVTDPPYYDNIGYADLSDFFYAWLRPVLRPHFPEFLGTMSTPKGPEIVANPRFEEPRQHFTDLMGRTLEGIRARVDDRYPTCIFYAYKQRDTRRNGVTSTGWETMLTALVEAGFQVVGTWPIATDKSTRMRALQSNALESSIVLVCRARPADAVVATRNEFEHALSAELPGALARMTGNGSQGGGLTPVDLRQAAIGPGMSVYSRFRRVEKLNGDPVTVGDALHTINGQVTMYLLKQVTSLDDESRFCLEWLEAHPRGEGPYAEAENLAKVHNISVHDRLVRTHRLVSADHGRVRLLGLDQYHDARRMPARPEPITAWESCFRMAWHMEAKEGRGGVAGCVAATRAMGGHLDRVEALGRVLYDLYNSRDDSANAIAFNNLISHWSEINAGSTSLTAQTEMGL